MDGQFDERGQWHDRREEKHEVFWVSREEAMGCEHWSGRGPLEGMEKLPQLGDHVMVTVNSIGPGVVCGYFRAEGEREERWAGVMVRLSDPPAWMKKQNAGKWYEPYALVFGAEIKLPEEVSA
jgi:hypothetical protein